jgi:C-22 sterol desaturase
MENATSFTSPLATVKYGAVNVPWQLDYVVDVVANAKGWQIVLTILALLVAYDQCMFSPCAEEKRQARSGRGKN